MTVKCQHCESEIADNPQRDLEDGLIDTYVARKVHPSDSIAVCKTWYYCDSACFVAEFSTLGGGEA